MKPHHTAARTTSRGPPGRLSWETAIPATAPAHTAVARQAIANSRPVWLRRPLRLSRPCTRTSPDKTTYKAAQPPCSTAIAVSHPGMSITPLPSAFLEQDHTDGGEQDQQVQKQVAVFHVIKVVGKLLAGVLDRGAIRVIHLRPAGDPGLHAGAVTVERDDLGELIDEMGAFRPRTNKPHFTLQHIDQLRQLVD